jgi:hypothetical protein
MSSGRVAVCLEITPKSTVASALDWPGWCRAGQDEGAALDALARWAERYAPVAERAGTSLPPRSPSTSSSGCLAGPRRRSPHPNAAARSRR